MSRLFYAVNRETGERWQPTRDSEWEEYLVMYDSGYIATVESNGWETSVIPLCSKTWKVVFNEGMQNKIDKSGES